MSLTKDQARTVIRSLLDDEARQRWGDASLDVLTQLVIDELWGELIDEVPWYSTQLDTIVSGTDGLVDLGLAGSLTERFGKLQKLTRDGIEYFPTTPRDFVMQTGSELWAPARSYAITGMKLYAFPLESLCQYELSYSTLPELYTDMLPADAVEWPDGFEGVFVFEAAARAMIRGEKMTIEMYQALSRQTFQRLKGAIKRQYVGPATINDLEDSMAIGGV